MGNKNVVVKQVIGIDIGKDSFYACYKVQHDDKSIVIKGLMDKLVGKKFHNPLFS